MARRKILVANWKAYVDTVIEAEKLFSSIKNSSARLKHTDLIICPPAVFIDALSCNFRGKSVSFGAQDVFWGNRGAHTGQTTVVMLKSVKTEYVIVGHSEVRALGETNEEVNKKIHSALSEKLRVILCIGEAERDRSGNYLEFLEEQLKSAFAGVDTQKLPRIMVAYEPVWAIGKSAEYAMTSTTLHETVLFVRKVLSQKYEKKLAFRMPILYGGSVEHENIAELFTKGEVDGFLVGHASVDSGEFGAMMKIVDLL